MTTIDDSIWHETTYKDSSITFYPKMTTTWKQMNTWLEEVYGDNGKDLHWKWTGFGVVGEKTFRVILARRPCNKCICKCEDDEESADEEDD